MSHAAKSLFVFGVYVGVLGLTLLIVPNVLLQFFAAPATNEVWIRIDGMFLICLCFFYVQAARHELTIFIRWTIPARIAVIFYLSTFVFLLHAPKALLLFGVVDLLAATWTWLALREK